MFQSPPRAFSPAASAARPALDGVAAALVDLIDYGLATCDANGRLFHVNRAAQRELASARVLRVVDGCVRSVDDRQIELVAAFRDAAIKQKNRLLLLGDPHDRLAAVTIPVTPVGAADAVVLLMLGQRSVCSPVAVEMLASRHELTHMERRVLSGLLANHSPREIAGAHRVSLPTIRTQIQSLREKIGVRSVDELLLYAAQIPPVGMRFESCAA